MASVVDVAGINSISARILSNAAAAMVGMVTAPPPPALDDSRPLVGASMFGVTTPCVTRAREQLERDGYEVLVFHATGVGGRALEGLAKAGHLAGVLDVTTTELADEVVGGTLSAGPDRLEAAGRAGIPQAVSLGAVDMVNFGAPRVGAGAVSGTQPLRAQRHRHADAHDARRSAPRSAGGSPRKLSAATGPGRAVRAAARRLDDRDRGRPVPRRRRRRGAVRGRARRPRPTTSSWSSWTATSTTTASPTRWPAGWPVRSRAGEH